MKFVSVVVGFLACVFLGMFACQGEATQKEEVKTVSWFKAHPEELQAKLAACLDNPGETSADPNCINAKVAATQSRAEKQSTAWKEAKQIEGMYTVWVISHPECPSSVKDLIRVAGKKGQELTDPWGSIYEIRCPSEHGLDIDVYSMGPDKKPGTDDDIGNWMTKPGE